MIRKSLAAIIASLAIVGSSIGCTLNNPLSPLETTPVPVATDYNSSAASHDNNPFAFEFTYDAKTAFTMLDAPVEGLKGTILSSDIEYMDVREAGNDGGPHIRPYTSIVLRDQTDEDYYLIYPAGKQIPPGTKVKVEQYWPLKSGVPLMNNMLVYLTSIKDSPYTDYFAEYDFLIQSSAPDGHVDGIIKLNGIDYIADETGK